MITGDSLPRRRARARRREIVDYHAAKASVTRVTGSNYFLFVRGVPPDCVDLHPVAIDMSPAKAGSEFRYANSSAIADLTMKGNLCQRIK